MLRPSTSCGSGCFSPDVGKKRHRRRSTRAPIAACRCHRFRFPTHSAMPSTGRGARSRRDIRDGCGRRIWSSRFTGCVVDPNQRATGRGRADARRTPACDGDREARGCACAGVPRGDASSTRSSQDGQQRCCRARRSIRGRSWMSACSGARACAAADGRPWHQGVAQVGARARAYDGMRMIDARVELGDARGAS